jgi:hypothetical protein
LRTLALCQTLHSIIHLPLMCRIRWITILVHSTHNNSTCSGGRTVVYFLRVRRRLVVECWSSPHHHITLRRSRSRPTAAIFWACGRYVDPKQRYSLSPECASWRMNALYQLCWNFNGPLEISSAFTRITPFYARGYKLATFYPLRSQFQQHCNSEPRVQQRLLFMNVVTETCTMPLCLFADSRALPSLQCHHLRSEKRRLSFG